MDQRLEREMIKRGQMFMQTMVETALYDAVVHHWPIKTREKVPTGKRRWGEAATKREIVRTLQPVQTKTVRVAFVPNGTSRPTRVQADFGVAGWYDFSLTTGNGIGSLRLTWQLDTKSLKMLREERARLWPPPPKKRKKADDEAADGVDKGTPGATVEGEKRKQGRRKRRAVNSAEGPKVVPIRSGATSPESS